MAIKFDKNTGEVDSDLDFDVVVKKQVTIPVLSIEGGGTFFVIPIEHPISKIMMNKKGRPKKNEDGSIATMKIIKIVNYKDKSVNSMVLPATAYGNLKTTYPDGILGYLFRIIIPKEKVTGKNYKQCAVDEIHSPKGLDEILANLKPPIVIEELKKLNNLKPEFWKALEPDKPESTEEDDEGDD